MSIFSAAHTTDGKRKCLRCGRPFVPRKEGQHYGPKCALKLAGQTEIDSQALVSGKVLPARKMPPSPGRARGDYAVLGYRA